ncbi:hypothetical protein CLOM_g21486 [Closterium sp. NIES-68]|nr:hypothetical protein CLOM_g21486 [Closterium sp. NIES-68]GJP81170.1 hypothetical protein CLOP_g11338 [Closterium sp. NIES-67]
MVVPRVSPESRPRTDGFAQGSDCPICWEAYDNSVRAPHVLLCGHTFCKHCVLILPIAVFNKLPSLHIQLPWLVDCPLCHWMTPRLVVEGNLQYPFKNFSLLWLLEASRLALPRGIQSPARHSPTRSPLTHGPNSLEQSDLFLAHEPRSSSITDAQVGSSSSSSSRRRSSGDYSSSFNSSSSSSAFLEAQNLGAQALGAQVLGGRALGQALGSQTSGGQTLWWVLPRVLLEQWRPGGSPAAAAGAAAAAAAAVAVQALQQQHQHQQQQPDWVEATHVPHHYLHRLQQQQRWQGQGGPGAGFHHLLYSSRQQLAVWLLERAIQWFPFIRSFINGVKYYLGRLQQLCTRLPFLGVLAVVSFVIVPWCSLALLCYLAVFLFVAVPAAVCLVLSIYWSEALLRRLTGMP